MRYVAEFAPQGEYLSLRRVGCDAPVGGVRGVVSGFSKQSRSRLLKKIAQIQHHRLPLFLTLTYPDAFPAEREQYKSDLNAFFMALKYFFPSLGAIWRLEFQSRGAPHYHLLLWGVDYARALDLIPRLWFQIAGADDENHLRFHRGELGNEHCLQPVRSWKGVKSYCAKYMTKPNDFELLQPGRAWGAIGKLPMSTLLTMRIDLAVALAFRRAHRRKVGFSPSRFGFWSFDYCPDWLRFVDEMQTRHEDENIPPPFPPGWWNGLRCPEVVEENPLCYL